MKFYLQVFVLIFLIPIIYSCKNKSDKVIESTSIVSDESSVHINEKLDSYKDFITDVNNTSKSFNTKLYRGEISCLINEVDLFEDWARKIYEAEKLDDPELNIQIEKTKEKIIKLQVREFPVIRNNFAQILDNKEIKKGLSHNITGANDEIIEFIGERYFDLDSIINDEAEIIDLMHKMRFKAAFYRYDKNSEILIRFNFKTLEDSQLSFDQPKPPKSLKERLNK